MFLQMKIISKIKKNAIIKKLNVAKIEIETVLIISLSNR